MKSKSTFSPFLSISGSSLLAVSCLHAAPVTWDPGATGTSDGAGAWLDTGKWWDGAANVDWVSGDDATFGNNGAGGAVTLASPTTVQSITFNSHTGTYTLGTSGQSITLNGGITKNTGSAAATFLSPITLGSNQTWTNNSTGLLLTGNGANLITNGGNQLTIDGTGNTTFGVLNNSAVTLSGTGALVKNGSGVFSIGGDNSAVFSGPVTLNDGILFYGDFPGSLGTGNLLITNGVLESRWSNGKTWAQGVDPGQIQITGGESGFALNGNTGVTFNIGAVTWGSATFNPTKFVLQNARSQSNSNLTFSSAINLNGADRTIVVSGGTTGAARAILSAAISNGTGTAGLLKEGSGMLQLTNNTSSWNGNTTVSGGMLDFGGININANIGGGSGRNISVAAGAGVRFNTLSNAILNRLVETNDEIIVMTGTTSNAFDFSSSTGANLPGAFLSNWAGNGAKTEISGIITPGGGAYRLGSLRQSGALGIRQDSLLSGNNQLIIGGNRVVIVGAHTFSGDTTIRDGGRLGLAAFTGGTDSLALQNSALDLGAPSATGQLFLEAGSTAGPITGANVSSPASLGLGTVSATFGGLKGSRNIRSAVVVGNTGNNTAGTAVANITGFTLNVATGDNHSYSGSIGGFGAGATGSTGGNSTLTKTGEGTQVFEGIHTYTGATTITGGTLGLGATGSITSSTSLVLGAAGTLDVSGQSSYAIPASQPVEFGVDAAGAGSAGRITAAELDITNATVTYNIAGTPDDAAYVLATYTNLVGTNFASVDAPPAGYTLDYAYEGNKIALVSSGGAPEIAVEQPALTDIGNNGSKAFGTVTIGSNTSLVFTIRNTGTAPLDLTGSPLVSISGDADFTVTDQPVTDPVPAGDTTTFTVQFAPAAAGARSATISIANNDSDENPFTINLTGTGQTAYQAWSGGAGFAVDTNGDGISNGVAFLLGATNPNEDATSRLPTVTQNGGNLVLTFNCLPAAARGSATLKVAHSNNLAAWTSTTAQVPDATNAVPDNNVTFVVVAGPSGPPALRNVTATIDSAAAAGGKLFGRLVATE